jgi:hypothetical protein
LGQLELLELTHLQRARLLSRLAKISLTYPAEAGKFSDRTPPQRSARDDGSFRIELAATTVGATAMTKRNEKPLSLLGVKKVNPLFGTRAMTLDLAFVLVQAML